MENSRFLNSKNILIIGGILFVIPFFVFGYDDRTTHPALTQEIIKLYNRYKENKSINTIDAEYIIKGSIDEDVGIRPMYHFYDPIYYRGLTFNEGTLPSDPRLAFAGGSIQKLFWESSKIWAQNTTLQSGKNPSFAGFFSDLFSSETDYSWDRAVYDYTWKDKERGLEGLGHILHLIEDASVPDHTRNDPHPPNFDGSPYERWTKKFNRSTFTLITVNKDPIKLSNISSYFDSLATYSNNNYFSEDSICNSKYQKPLADFERTETLSDGKKYIFQYKESDSKGPYRISIKSPDSNWYEINQKTKCKFSVDDNDDLILSDYWTRLSEQAVLHGAGVIKLFFDEVEKEKQTKTLYNKNRSWIAKTTEKAIDSVVNIFQSNSNRVMSMYTNLGGILFGGEDKTAQEANTRDTESKPPQEPTNALTNPQISQTSAPAFPARTNTENSLPKQSGNQPETNVIPITSSPLSQDTSPFLPIAGGGGAPPKKSPLPEETISVPTPQIEETPTTTASTTPIDESPVYIDPPVILEPTASTTLFATTTLTFIGAAEPNRIIQETTTNASTTSDAFSAWALTLFSLPEGTTTLTFFASDLDGNISSGTPRTIFIHLAEATSSPPIDTPPPVPTGPMPGPFVGDIAEIPMLNSPRSLVITDDGAKALIADGNRISELDLTSGSIRTLARGLENPTRMTIEASKETALVLEARSSESSGDRSGRLTRINFLTGEKTILAAGLDSPRGIAIEREDETALVRANGIYRVNLLTGTTTLLLSAPINGDITVDSRGAQAFFLTEEIFKGIGSIKKIDLATNDVTTIAGPLGESIRGDAIEISPDETFALIIASGGDTGIIKIDLRTGEESNIFSPGTALFGSYSITDIALSPDARDVFFWWTSPTEGLMLGSINLTNREFKTIARARTPRAIAITTDARSVIAANQVFFGWLFDQVEFENGIGTRFAAFAQDATSFALTSNDTEIITISTDRDFISSIERIDLITGVKTALATDIPFPIAKVVIEPNGETALVSATGKLIRVNLTTGEISVISESIEGAGPIAIEKSGRSALLLIPRGATTDLLRIDLASSTTIKYISSINTSAAPVGIDADPDGETAVIAFTNALVRVNLETGETTIIRSPICESAGIQTMALENTGETALVSHDTCGLIRVRVK